MHQRKFAGLTVGGWIGLLIVILIGRTLIDYRADGKTNLAYLRGLLEAKTIEQTASELVTSWKTAGATEHLDQSVNWQDVERRLAECMDAEARKYLASDDPYLRRRADSATPQVLAKKLLAACGAAD